MRLLVTRTVREAERLAQLLGARGHDCTVAPLIDIVPRPGAVVDCRGAQGFLATSANGVRCLADATARRDLPLYAVGDATAKCALDQGFVQVHTAGGDVVALDRLVAGLARPADGHLIHAAAATLAGDLAGRLRARGFTVETATLYDSVTATTLAPDVAAALQVQAFDGVLFFSPRTAATFVNLARSLGAELARGTAYCLSAAVATVVAPLGFGRVLVASHPTETDLVALIDGA